MLVLANSTIEVIHNRNQGNVMFFLSRDKPREIVCLCVCVRTRSVLLTLCDLLDCSLSSCSVHGSCQAKILEWVAISFSRGSSGPRNRTCVFRVSCTGRQILYHCGTWETPCISIHVCGVYFHHWNISIHTASRMRFQALDMPQCLPLTTVLCKPAFSFTLLTSTL